LRDVSYLVTDLEPSNPKLSEFAKSLKVL